jgi:tetratricopeptide (TPR) repeat protein
VKEKPLKNVRRDRNTAKPTYNEVSAAFVRTEQTFERYLLADRIDLLNTMPKTIRDVRSQLDDTVCRFMQAFQGVQIVLRKVQNKNIYTMCRSDVETKSCVNEGECHEFLIAFLDTLESLMSVLTIENALYYKRIELVDSNDRTDHRIQEKDLANHDEDLQKKLESTIEGLRECLRFLNKNTADSVADFFLLRESNKELFATVNSVRVFGYVLRAYLKYILLKKTPKYALNTSDYEYVLNDCNKVANILERDFRISMVQHDDGDSNGNATSRRWVYLSAIAANFLKGHIYYAIRNNSRALDCFYRGIRLYENVKNLEGFRANSETPFDVAKAKLMLGKTFSDKGLFLDSLLWHLSALDDFLALFQKNPGIGKIREAIQSKTELLTREKHNDIVSKEVVSTVLKSIPICDLQLASPPNSTTAWAKGYVSDIINRAGYVFYILLWRTAGSENETMIRRWYDTALRISPTNSLARQNLYLLPGEDEFNPKWLSAVAGPARRLNLLALLKLNMAEGDEKGLERDILRSMLTNLENIITVPQRFNKRINVERRIDADENINKLMFLRRWNSYTPVIPRPVDFNRGGGSPHFYSSNNCPGGGYFLVWNKKGIVIDPGFDFIRNLYSAGYSISDIDAIIITHAHIDHMSDFFALLTLIYERKDLREQLYGDKSDFRKIDLFMNIGAMNGFLPWCAAQTKETICNIHSLPRNSDLRSRENFMLDLTGKYQMKIEITKASHKENYTRDWAIGLKFHLARTSSERKVVLGITSDTSSDPNVLEQYGDCDLLSVHLGDINFKEALQFSGISLSGFRDQIVPKKLSEEEIANLKELAVSLGVPGQDLQNVTDPRQIVELIVKDEESYELKNHLGFKGAYELSKSLLSIGSGARQKLVVFSEFPEYFGSFRKRIARHFNERLRKDGIVFVTGDLGLHVKIDPESTGGEDVFRIQCNKCARDNDVSAGACFHRVDDIQETCVKATDESIVYYCQRHHIEPDEHFINKISQ